MSKHFVCLQVEMRKTYQMSAQVHEVFCARSEIREGAGDLRRLPGIE